MNRLEIVKKAAGYAVGGGVSKIVSSIIANNVNPETKIEKIEVFAGAAVLGMMVKDASKTYTDAKIDKTVASLKRIKAKMDEAQTKQQEQ